MKRGSESSNSVSKRTRREDLWPVPFDEWPVTTICAVLQFLPLAATVLCKRVRAAVADQITCHLFKQIPNLARQSYGYHEAAKFCGLMKCLQDRGSITCDEIQNEIVPSIMACEFIRQDVIDLFPLLCGKQTLTMLSTNRQYTSFWSFSPSLQKYCIGSMTRDELRRGIKNALRDGMDPVLVAEVLSNSSINHSVCGGNDQCGVLCSGPRAMLNDLLFAQTPRVIIEAVLKVFVKDYASLSDNCNINDHRIFPPRAYLAEIQESGLLDVTNFILLWIEHNSDKWDSNLQSLLENPFVPFLPRTSSIPVKVALKVLHRLSPEQAYVHPWIRGSNLRFVARRFNDEDLRIHGPWILTQFELRDSDLRLFISSALQLEDPGPVLRACSRHERFKSVVGGILSSLLSQSSDLPPQWTICRLLDFLDSETLSPDPVIPEILHKTHTSWRQNSANFDRIVTRLRTKSC